MILCYLFFSIVILLSIYLIFKYNSLTTTVYYIIAAAIVTVFIIYVNKQKIVGSHFAQYQHSFIDNNSIKEPILIDMYRELDSLLTKTFVDKDKYTSSKYKFNAYSITKDTLNDYTKYGFVKVYKDYEFDDILNKLSVFKPSLLGSIF